MQRLVHIIDRVASISGHFSGWLVVLIMILMFFEVFMRYVMSQPPMVADEVSAYMLVALCFLGAAYTWMEKGHVRITALITRLPKRLASWLRVVTLVLAFLFTIGLCQASYGYMATSFKLQMTSASSLRVPLQGPQITVAIGFVILCLLVIADIARAVMNLRAGKSVEGEDR